VTLEWKHDKKISIAYLRFEKAGDRGVHSEVVEGAEVGGTVVLDFDAITKRLCGIEFVNPPFTLSESAMDALATLCLVPKLIAVVEAARKNHELARAVGIGCGGVNGFEQEQCSLCAALAALDAWEGGTK